MNGGIHALRYLIPTAISPPSQTRISLGKISEAERLKVCESVFSHNDETIAAGLHAAPRGDLGRLGGPAARARSCTHKPASLSGGGLFFRFCRGSRNCPQMIRKGDAAFEHTGALALEQTALQAGKGLANGDSSAGGNHAVPGNGLTSRAGGHGSSRGTSAAREPNGLGQLAIGDDAAFGNALDQCVEASAGRIHRAEDSRKDGLLPISNPEKVAFLAGRKRGRKAPGSLTAKRKRTLGDKLQTIAASRARCQPEATE